jgi:antirestriction protein ArdC
MSDKSNFETALEKLTPQQQKIVAQILENLDGGRLVWRKGWNAENLRDSFGAPNNPITGTVYGGVNAFWLASQGYADPRWLTFNQMTEKGYSFKKNADGSGAAKGKGVQIEFFTAYDKLTKKPFDKNDTEFVKLSQEEQIEYFKENVTFPRKNYTVFNASLIDGIEPFKVTEEDKLKRNETVECILSNSEAPISYDGGDHAYYRPASDSIHLPPRAAFSDAEELYGTALHEIGHSTGHPTRLNRDMSGGFGSESYAQEELRAEFSSALMSIQYGVSLSPDHVQNHAAYIQSWKNRIRENPQTLIDAIRDAQKIVTYVNSRMSELASEQSKQPEQLSPSSSAPLGGREVVSPKAVADNADIPLPAADGVSVNFEATANNAPAWILQRRVKTLSNIEANIPAEMKALPNWCAFNSTFDRESGKYKKSIWNCNSDDGKKWAKSNDHTTWTTFEKALSYAKANGCDGLSFALTKESKIFCVDLDGAKADGKYSPLAWEISNGAKGTYAERSVSAKGLHFFGVKGGSLEAHAIFDGSMSNKSKDNKLELYDGSRFMSITGDIFTRAKTSLATFTENDKLVAVVKGQLSERQAVIAAPQKTTSYPSMQNANEVIERIRNSRVAREFNDLYAGQDLNGDRSRSDLRLCGIAAFFSGGDAGITKEIFMSSGLYRGGEKSAGYVDRTVNLAVKNLRTQIKPPKASDNGK